MNNQQEKNIDVILADVKNELTRAIDLFETFHSAHEGYGVLLEEVDELWDIVKINGDNEAMIEEAIQVAAMAVRFVLDVCMRRVNDNEHT